MTGSKFAGLRAMRAERQAEETTEDAAPADAVAAPAPAAQKLGRPRTRSPEQPVTGRTNSPGAGRPVGGKRSNPDYRPVTLLLRSETYVAAQRVLLTRGEDVSDVVEQLLAEWVGKQES